MSETDDKTKEVYAKADSEGIETSSMKAGKKGQREFPLGSIILFFIIGLAVSLVIGWVVFPKLLYSKKKQSVDFNHALHAEQVENGCESCHIFREDGSFAGVPKLAQCSNCHQEVQGDSPNEKVFVEEYVSEGKEVPWLIYSKQPDCVFFSHTVHVKKAKMECAVCHGGIAKSTSLKQYEQNRITGYSRDIWGKSIAGIKENSWDRMKMDDCAKCHEKETGKKSSVQTGKEACFACHK